LVGKLEGKGPLGRPRRRWIDNIKMELLEIGVSVVHWIGLAQDRYRRRALVNAVMNIRVPQNAGNLPSGCSPCGLSSGTQLHRVSCLIPLVAVLNLNKSLCNLVCVSWQISQSPPRTSYMPAPSVRV
jgi:hypothetical protein